MNRTSHKISVSFITEMIVKKPKFQIYGTISDLHLYDNVHRY